MQEESLSLQRIRQAVERGHTASVIDEAERIELTADRYQQERDAAREILHQFIKSYAGVTERSRTADGMQVEMFEIWMKACALLGIVATKKP
jgi:hypothetical protein